MATDSNERLKTEDKLAWIYLANLIFYFIPMFVSPMTNLDIILSLIALAIFFPLYFKLHNCSHSQVKTPLAALFLLSVLITPINPGSLAFFTYCGFYAGFHYRFSKTAWLWTGQIITIWFLNWYLFSGNYYFAIWGTGLTVGIGMIGVASRKQEESIRLRQQSGDEIKTLATMVERERIARDLHDVMGHSLSSITLKAELAGKLIDNQQFEKAKQHLDELTVIARDNLSQLRQTVSNYKRKGLATTVTDLCQRLRDKGLYADIEGDLPCGLTTLQESHLTLILTELTNNILRHSHSSHCTFKFDQFERTHLISVIENNTVTSISEGNGLKGIRERLQDIGGEFNYQLSPALTFTITLPLLEENDVD